MNEHAFAVFDIDGVLADVGHRLHHLTGRRKHWGRFFAAADADPILEQGRARLLDAAENHPIVYVSGRPERLRRVTQHWLDRHDLPAGALLLRPNGDHRPARLLKVELLGSVAAHGSVAFVVDDDVEVCRSLRSAGYTVHQATWAPTQDAMRDAQEREGRS